MSDQRIQNRREQVERLEGRIAEHERAIRALRTRLARARRSLGALERAEEKAGPVCDAKGCANRLGPGAVPGLCAGCEAAARDAAALDALKQAPPAPLTHFRVWGAEEPRRLISRADGKIHRFSRALCTEGHRLDSLCYVLREDRTVTCPGCMVLKDAWLERGQKPLTIRRLRALKAELQKKEG